MTAKTYVAFLRGINVGGHHKVPMAFLKKELEKLGFSNISTILNSGNIIFDSQSPFTTLENDLENHFQEELGFAIPVIVRKKENILDILKSTPFKDFEMNKQKRLYVSFLKEDITSTLELPKIFENGSFTIKGMANRAVYSVLDLSISKTPKAMNVLEQLFGKNITTRNWNTVERIGKIFQ